MKDFKFELDQIVWHKTAGLGYEKYLIVERLHAQDFMGWNNVYLVKNANNGHFWKENEIVSKKPKTM